MGNATSAIAETVSGISNTVKEAAVSTWNGVSGAAQSLGEGAAGFVTNLVNGQPGEAFASIGNGIIGAGQAAYEGVTGVGKAAVEGTANVVSGVAQVGAEVVDDVTDGAQTAADAVGAGDAVRSVLNAVDKTAGVVGNNVGHATDAVSAVATQVLDGGQQVVSAAAEGTQQVVGAVMQGDFAGAAEAAQSAVVDTAEQAGGMVRDTNATMLDAATGYVENITTEYMQAGAAVTHAVGDATNQVGLPEVSGVANAVEGAFTHVANHPEIVSAAVEEVVAGTPGVGHLVSISQAVAGRGEEAAATLMNANAGTAAAVGGLVAGPMGAVAGLVGGELINTGINSAVHGEWRPTGFIDKVNDAANGEDVGVNLLRAGLDIGSAAAGGVSGVDKAAQQGVERAVQQGMDDAAQVVEKGAAAASGGLGELNESLQQSDTQPAPDQNGGPSAPEDEHLSGISFPGQAVPAAQPVGGDWEESVEAAMALLSDMAAHESKPGPRDASDFLFDISFPAAADEVIKQLEDVVDAMPPGADMLFPAAMPDTPAGADMMGAAVMPDPAFGADSALLSAF